MSISIKALGAGQEVGRSCVIVRIKDVKIMFDCGVHMAYNDQRKFPDFKKILEIGKPYQKIQRGKEKYQNRYKSKKSEIEYNQMYSNLSNENESIDYTSNLDLVIITHFHLDHVGALPYFTEICGYNGPILTSQPTKAILPLTLEDFRKIISDYRGEKSPLSALQVTNCVSKIDTIEIGETKIIKNRIKVTPYYAGHVLGAGMYHIEVDGHTVVYTGDYNTLTDRHLSAAYIPKIYPDVFITETTYGDTVRDTKRVREREFLKKIQSVIERGGKVLIPIFALGRAQELCILLDTHWRRTNCKIPIYFAGAMAEKANFYYKIFTNWTNNAVKNIFLEHNVFDFSFVKHGDKSVMKANTPMVIFATPGMIHGGLSLQIFKEIAPDEKNCVIIPGYCTTGTVGNKILNGERIIEIDKQNIEVKCDVYYMSFSAHADAKGILSLVKNASPKNLVLVHGDVEVMKKFQKTVQNVLNINTYMPPNFEEIPFERIMFYNQINISKNFFEYLNFMLNTKKYNKISKNLNEIKGKSDLKENEYHNKGKDGKEIFPYSTIKLKDSNNIDKENKFLSMENIQNLKNRITLNLKMKVKNGERILSFNNPLSNLNKDIGLVTNYLSFKLNEKNKNLVDIRILFENFLKEKKYEIYEAYSTNISNNFLEFIRENEKIKIKWSIKKNEKIKNKIIFNIIKILKSFLNLIK